MDHEAKSTEPAVTVMFDGSCPLCRKEIGVYRGLCPIKPIAWCDVSAPETDFPDPDSRSAYMARFHVKLADGSVLSGAAAFIALWSVLPGWRWLGRVGQWPGIEPVMEKAYRLFLVVRPSMQRLMRKRTST